jgi:glycolate oxidase FAD binding subunit
MNDWAGTPLPISATCWVDERLYVRLQGSTAALAHARRRMGGEELAGAQAFWTSIKEHTHPFFHRRNLWRLTVPCASAVFDVPGRTLMEWTGAQRWLVPDDARADLHEHSVRAGGFATRFRAAEQEARCSRRCRPPSCASIASSRRRLIRTPSSIRAVCMRIFEHAY